MKKKSLFKVAAIVFMIIVCLSTTAVFAKANSDQSIGSANSGAAKYLYITKIYHDLTLGSGGKLTCEGMTQVQSGYYAGVNMELQQLVGSNWTTIKPWNGMNLGRTYLIENWYVARGTYRLKLTHTAKLTSNGAVLETVTQIGRAHV